MGSTVQIQVMDSGAGIRPEFLPHIFDRFSQADSSTTRTHSGLGLGLAIVNHLIDLHGGSVRAESGGEGKGATFTVTLPLPAVELTAGPPGPQSAESGAESARTDLLSGRHVLVVEDNSDMREWMRVVLSKSGARVTAAGSACEALKAAQRNPPDVLVSDIGMPGEDGFQLLKSLRQEGFPELPALAVSAYAREEDRREALAAGYQAHLSKPVAASELIVTLSRLLL
jgi:CheY-like chemotaxis protein